MSITAVRMTFSLAARPDNFTVQRAVVIRLRRAASAAPEHPAAVTLAAIADAVEAGGEIEVPVDLRPADADFVWITLGKCEELAIRDRDKASAAFALLRRAWEQQTGWDNAHARLGSGYGVIR